MSAATAKAETKRPSSSSGRPSSTSSSAVKKPSSSSKDSSSDAPKKKESSSSKDPSDVTKKKESSETPKKKDSSSEKPSSKTLSSPEKRPSSSSKSRLAGAISKERESKKPITEEELKKLEVIRSGDVLRLNLPTQTYLCKPSDNVYGIDFVEFKIRDAESNKVLFHVQKPPGLVIPVDDNDDTGRFVRYDFHAGFLKIKSVGTTVVFAVGSKPISNFRMIERHYFKDRLLKSFEFDFGFCIPNSTNSCEQIYVLPELSEKEIQEMVDAPYETRSDSFYFVDDKLVMHNKADYRYIR
eukprot:Colp12_sorted_trinity150504_noHs@4341